MPEKRRRISSLTPVITSVGALLMGSALSLAAMLSAAQQPVFAALVARSRVCHRHCRHLQRGAGERLPCNTRGPFGVAVRLRLRRAVSIAVDAGGVATGPLANTFLLALALGASSVVAGQDPLVHGLGLAALIALAPIISVMMLGLLVRWRTPPREIAALVTDSSRRSFAAELYHFGTQPRNLEAELFLLSPGDYQLTLTPTGTDNVTPNQQRVIHVEGPRVGVSLGLPARGLCLVKVSNVFSKLPSPTDKL